jgi:DeoR/GlpR family transcriptional regulator of sugar metabolism
MLQQSGGSSDGHRERETSQQREKSKLHQKAKRLISEGKKLQGKLVRYDHRGKTAA